MDETTSGNNDRLAESLPRGGKYTYIFDISLTIGVLEGAYVRRQGEARNSSDIERTWLNTGYPCY
jgi:hypothetical protein